MKTMSDTIPTAMEILISKLHPNFFTKSEEIMYLELERSTTILNLKALSEEIKEKAETQMCQDGKGCGVAYCNIPCDSIDKQSITTITEKYIENLKQPKYKKQ